MPRKHRIEFPGALYHVISRGNYRKELFLTEGSGESFEKALFECVGRCGWKMHAYMIMSNHYHLAVETPEPNLVTGMKWLQSTFATRFNRFRGERGHVFQGRYKALVIGEERALTGLVDYIHLNPVRAGICSLEELKGYRLSSYSKYFKRRVASELCRTDFLSILGLPDTVAGMNRYRRHLELSEASDPARREALMKRYHRGWFIGSKDEKKALIKDLRDKHPDVVWDGSELAELNQARWETLVKEQLKQRKRSEGDLKRDPKGAPWKIAIARELRNRTTANNQWIAERLHMGHPSRVSNLICNQ